MADERGLAPSSLALPNLDSAVMAARHDAQAVAVYGPHALDVAKERLEWLAGLDVPHLDGVVERAREKDGRRVRGRSRVGGEDALLLPAERSAAGVCTMAKRPDCGWWDGVASVCDGIEAMWRGECGRVEPWVVWRRRCRVCRCEAR